MTRLQEELTTCYDAQALHFHHTRWIHKRPELEYIKPLLLEQCSQQTWNSLEFLDLGCGAWRVSKRLEDIWCKYTYTWVDISSWMIETAQEQYPDAMFVCQDMISYLQQQKQQSVDCVLCLASFHHLTSLEDRLLVLHNLYRTLTYWGIIILVNWSFSDWFLKKYWTSLAKAIPLSIATVWNKAWNDLSIPRKDPKYHQNNIMYHRFYHLFTLNELQKLIWLTDFSITQLSYMSQSWELISSWKDSRNSICILKK